MGFSHIKRLRFNTDKLSVLDYRWDYKKADIESGFLSIGLEYNTFSSVSLVKDLSFMHKQNH